ncbi:MAG TPA: hypothetical protein VIJ96_19705 [Acidothermaceae bacterium]
MTATGKVVTISVELDTYQRGQQRDGTGTDCEGASPNTFFLPGSVLVAKSPDGKVVSAHVLGRGSFGAAGCVFTVPLATPNGPGPFQLSVVGQAEVGSVVDAPGPKVSAATLASGQVHYVAVPADAPTVASDITDDSAYFEVEGLVVLYGPSRWTAVNSVGGPGCRGTGPSTYLDAGLVMAVQTSAGPVASAVTEDGSVTPNGENCAFHFVGFVPGAQHGPLRITGGPASGGVNSTPFTADAATGLEISIGK